MILIKLIKKLIRPKQSKEAQRRQELILNILLVFSSACFLVINLIRIIDHLIYPEERGLPLWSTLLIFAAFAFLLWLSRRGQVRLAAILLVIIFSLPMFSSFFFWGADLPAALLLAVLVITLSGILLGARFAFISTLFIAGTIIVLTDLQTSGSLKVDSYWRDDPSQIGDAIAYSVLLLLIASVAWLFCREINRSLKRAWESEALLRMERDSLEIKVEERTRELRELEAEKINQLYRLAEFGRISSGIFHDLINPLSAVSLNLEQIKSETDTKIISAKSYLNQALLATSKMEGLIASIKKQITRESTINLFSLNQEIDQVIQILSYKARRAGVAIEFICSDKVELKGDAIKFSQIISNLLANAIEACEDSEIKQIKISLLAKETEIMLKIVDSGSGIVPENLNKIFNPFFSTKQSSGRGLGLGLASTKNIIEKDFQGKIEVTSALHQGTSFLITLPKKND